MTRPCRSSCGRNTSLTGGRCRPCIEDEGRIPNLDPAPLLELVRAFERTHENGRRLLAQFYADRYDVKLLSAYRQIQRLHSGTALVRGAFADRLSLLLGSHPALLWPREWSAA